MNYLKIIFLIFSFCFFAQLSVAEDKGSNSMPGMQMGSLHESNHLPMEASDCSDMETWDLFMGMCMPLPMEGMSMKMLMLHGNSFFTETSESGPRGKTASSVPNMFMADIGSSIGDHQYFNLDFMGTVERWTLPSAGYPELLQIGESNQDGVPYLDAQHPHSSPIMGLTLSDTISLIHDKDYIKLSIAPRGESTDGPIAFMHRPTGMVNPDAPLGHHIGQDVGHISSSVIAASLHLSDSTFEFSTFSGTEPQPSQVDLPVYTPNSYAARYSYQLSKEIYAMVSTAFVKSPEPSDPTLDHVWRYSASVYNEHSFENGWLLHNALIWGLINNYDHTSALNSFAEEFWFHKNAANIWSRIEVLQRTPGELEISSPSPNDPQWVTALTLGYTHQLATWDSADIGLGGSLTVDILPPAYSDVYGGLPISGKVFLQVSGMKMWDL